jgi:hypothetical protein
MICCWRRGYQADKASALTCLFVTALSGLGSEKNIFLFFFFLAALKPFTRPFSVSWSVWPGAGVPCSETARSWCFCQSLFFGRLCSIFGTSGLGG